MLLSRLAPAPLQAQASSQKSSYHLFTLKKNQNFQVVAMNRQFDRDRKKASKATTFSSFATKALAAYGAYKFVSWAWREFGANPTNEDSGGSHEESCLRPLSLAPTTNEDQYRKNRHQMSMSIARRRQQRIAYCQKETIHTMDSLLITLKNTISSHTDFSKQIRDLKQMKNADSSPSSTQRDHGRTKQDIWDEIKIMSVTRLVVTVYAHSLLVLLLSIQINVLGGTLFREQLKQEPGDRGSRLHVGQEQSLLEEPQQSEEEKSCYHKILVQTYENFFRRVVSSLVNDIQRVVEVELSKWNVIDEREQKVCNVTLQEFEERLKCIRQKLDSIQLGQYICKILSDCEISLDKDVRLAFEESLDVLESPVFENVNKEVINMTFDVVGMKGYAPLFHDSDRPIVSIITKLKNVCNIFYVSPNEPYEQRWVDKPMNGYPNIFLYNFDRINSVKELGDISFG
jgi:hypothetical protein